MEEILTKILAGIGILIIGLLVRSLWRLPKDFVSKETFNIVKKELKDGITRTEDKIDERLNRIEGKVNGKEDKHDS